MTSSKSNLQKNDDFTQAGCLLEQARYDESLNNLTPNDDIQASSDVPVQPIKNQNQLLQSFSALTSGIAILSLIIAIFGYACFISGYMYYAYKNPATKKSENTGIDLDAMKKMSEAKEFTAQKACGKDINYHWTPDGNLVCSTPGSSNGKVTLFDVNSKSNNIASLKIDNPNLNIFSPTDVAEVVKETVKKKKSKRQDSSASSMNASSAQ